MNDVMAPRRRNLAPVIGCCLVAMALLLSGSVLESTIFPSGTVVGTSRRAAALAVLRIGLAAAGLYALVKKPRLTTVHLTAMLAGTAIAGAIGALFLQLLLAPPVLMSGWKSGLSSQQQNQLGFRGRRIAYSPEDYVVLLLGDSQVEATALSFDEMPEQSLERHLGGQGTKVFSVGAGGYGQDQELLALEEYFASYRADLVVLWETPANDVWNNLFNTHMYNRNPKPTFWLGDQRQMQGPSEFLQQPLADSPIVVAQLWQRAFGLPWRDRSWERSLPEPYVPLDHYSGPVRSEWQQRWDGNIGRMRDEDLASEKSHLAIGLTPRSPRMQYGLDLTRALMQRIHDRVTAQRGKLVVFQTDTHDFAHDDEVYVLNDKYYRVSKRQYEANWNYVNDGYDAEVIPVTVTDWRVGPEDGHLNMHATDQVMSDLAGRLRTRVAANRSTPFSDGVQ